jgi:hypothetical protein
MTNEELERFYAYEAEQWAKVRRLLYGDTKPLTRAERLKIRLSDYRQRLSDAWLVLKGHASID